MRWSECKNRRIAKRVVPLKVTGWPQSGMTLLSPRLQVVGILFLFLVMFVSALDEPSVGIGGEDVERIQNITGSLPIDPDTGKVDFEKYKPFKTKADERIAAINEYVGPITKVLFGVELTLSWIFIFSVVLWILLIELIIMPVSEIFDWNIWWSLTGSGIIATLAMQGFGKDFVIWIEALVTAWYIGAVVIVGAAFFGVVYSIFIRYLGFKIKRMKKAEAEAKTEEDRAVIHARRELAEKELKAYT